MHFPVRYFVVHTLAYVLMLTVLLVAAHILVTITFDVNPLYLRLASIVIPLPFGLLLYARQRIRFGGAALVTHFGSRRVSTISRYQVFLDLLGEAAVVRPLRRIEPKAFPANTSWRP